MLVSGVEISGEVVKGMEERIFSGPFDHGALMWFCYNQLIKAGTAADVAHKASDRAADRLLQWHKRRGAIRYTRKEGWSLTGKENEKATA